MYVTKDTNRVIYYALTLIAPVIASVITFIITFTVALVSANGVGDRLLAPSAARSPHNSPAHFDSSS